MKTIIKTIILLLACAFSAEATVQERDILIIRGKRIYTYDTPRLTEAFPKLSIPEFEIVSTANYKGYTATWAVFDDHLHLVGLEALIEKSGELLWDEKVLKGQQFPVKVKAWSGVVKQSSPVSSFDPNTGKSEQYNEVTIIKFEKGKVTKIDFDKKVPRNNDTEEE